MVKRGFTVVQDLLQYRGNTIYRESTVKRGFTIVQDILGFSSILLVMY